MAIWNLGSINADNFFAVPHLPRAGETLAATGFSRGLGGKGANMSVAIARAGGEVHHIGAVGPDGIWMRDRMAEYGVLVKHIARVDEPSGRAMVAIDPYGENQIIIHPGVNITLDRDRVIRALSQAQSGDIFLCQNETNQQIAAAKIARDMEMPVAYAAAPFDPAAVVEMLELADLLVLNAVEAEQLEAGLGKSVDALPVRDVIVTQGKSGCSWINNQTGKVSGFSAPRVKAVDTTGAGDTFTGYLLAGLDQGLGMPASVKRAVRAAALKVTRHGTADAIPDARTVDSWSISAETAP